MQGPKKIDVLLSRLMSDENTIDEIVKLAEDRVKQSAIVQKLQDERGRPLISIIFNQDATVGDLASAVAAIQDHNGTVAALRFPLVGKEDFNDDPPHVPGNTSLYTMPRGTTIKIGDLEFPFTRRPATDVNWVVSEAVDSFSGSGRAIYIHDLEDDGTLDTDGAGGETRTHQYSGDIVMGSRSNSLRDLQSLSMRCLVMSQNNINGVTGTIGAGADLHTIFATSRLAHRGGIQQDVRFGFGQNWFLFFGADIRGREPITRIDTGIPVTEYIDLEIGKNLDGTEFIIAKDASSGVIKARFDSTDFSRLTVLTSSIAFVVRDRDSGPVGTTPILKQHPVFVDEINYQINAGFVIK